MRLATSNVIHFIFLTMSRRFNWAIKIVHDFLDSWWYVNLFFSDKFKILIKWNRILDRYLNNQKLNDDIHINFVYLVWMESSIVKRSASINWNGLINNIWFYVRDLYIKLKMYCDDISTKMIYYQEFDDYHDSQWNYILNTSRFKIKSLIEYQIDMTMNTKLSILYKRLRRQKKKIS